MFSLTDRMFVWGRYRNTYVVHGKDGNVDTCSFDVFVRSEYKPSVLQMYRVKIQLCCSSQATMLYDLAYVDK